MNTLGFDNRRFRELLSGQQAWTLLYLPAAICPCRDRQTGSPSKNCPVCAGYGFTWQSPPLEEWSERFYMGSIRRPPVLRYKHVKAEDILEVRDEQGTVYPFQLEAGRIVFPTLSPPVGAAFTVRYRAPLTVLGHISGLSSQREVGEEGIWEHKTLTLTLSDRMQAPDGSWRDNPAYNAEENDRFVVVDATTRVQQVLWRGENERLLYGYIYTVLSCHSLARKTYARQDWQYGSDFTLEGGLVRWQPGRGPEDGLPYSVSYLAAPEWYVFRSADLTRRQGGQNLPKRLTLRSWELYPQPGAERR
ncbi:hypothetical protein [Meiothermus sp. Pnk-1]|uniref:hypothetical protein n=1 Tax=Meiothermus sp. Pnk-1 TaxID=873128 RepID=UPI000D7CB2D6|nr:hypothetical protein [Meiothermus sp. Pnk-1]PZA08309.1 hypothetical protein DNA98_04010 [Meiothermus sp. Pnk-1]